MTALSSEKANMRSYNLILGFFWIVVGVGLIVFHLRGQPMWGYEPTSMTGLFGILSLVVAAYNFVRWYASRARRPVPPAQPKKRYLDERKPEYHAEFDFDRSAPDDPRNEK